MEAYKYLEMADIQGTHWWFRGRRHLFAATIDELALPGDARLLEIGCGTGANLPVLERFGRVYGVEMDEFSREHSRAASGLPIEDGYLPDNLPFENETFDLICLFDVLEHIEDDVAALEALRQKQAGGGRVVFTVPAVKWLYGRHDKAFHHHRRYSRAELGDKLRSAGFEVERLSYFNTFLFPLAIAARAVDLVRSGHSSVGMSTPIAPINELFYRLFISEKPFMRRSLLPLGLSLMAIVRAP